MTPKSTVKASRPAWSALLSVVLVVGVLALRFGVWHAEAQSDVSPRALSVALAVPQATFTVNTADDENTLCNAAGCSLREAIEAAAAGDEIKFSTLFDSPQTIALQHGEIVIEKNLTITGPGANLLTVSGNNQSRVLRVSRNFTVNISGMTLAGGNGVSNTNPGLGGAILTQGNLTLTRLRINGNTGGNGGAIFNGAGGVLRVIESQISGNTATNRGGGISTNSNLTVLRSTLLNNTAQGGITGGGIDASGPLSVINSTISNNRVTNVIGPNGGGILVYSGRTPRQRLSTRPLPRISFPMRRARAASKAAAERRRFAIPSSPAMLHRPFKTTRADGMAQQRSSPKTSRTRRMSGASSSPLRAAATISSETSAQRSASPTI